MSSKKPKSQLASHLHHKKLNNESEEKDGKCSHDSGVQMIDHEADMREKLQISFDEKSIASKPHSHLGIRQQRERLSDSMLLQKVSGGRALQGVYLTKSLGDQLQVRDQLLEVPQDVIITGPARPTSDIIKHFSSTHQEDEYRKTLDVLGVSAALELNIPIYTIGTGLAIRHGREGGQDHQEDRQEAYSSTIKFSTLHVASYTFKSSDLLLSKDAKDDLKKILKMLRVQKASISNLQEECKRFFVKYGSHANRGPLSFGGNFKSKCSSKGFEISETDSVKKMQDSAVTAEAVVSFAGCGVPTEVDMNTAKEEYSSKCSKQTLSNTNLQVTIEGGPPEASDMSVWKNGLVENNSTWILTDRGQKLEAVWDIIKRNHQKELGNVVDVLRTSWEKITGLEAEQDLSVGIIDPERIRDEVSQWNEETLTPHLIEGNLDRLVTVRSDIMTKTSDPSIWINEYISSPVIQKFFESIVDAEEEPSGHAKFLMRQLVLEEDLKQVSMHHFRSIDKISNWLYKSNKTLVFDFPRGIENFENFLKKVLDDTKLNASQAMDSKEPNEKITIQVSQAIIHLQSLYEGRYESVLITILISQFQDDSILLKPLSLKNLENLHKCFSEEWIEFNQYNMEKENPQHLQVYLLRLSVKMCPESRLKQLLQEVGQMMNTSNPPLNKKLIKEINKVTRGSSITQSIKVFKKALESIMVTPPSSEPHLFSLQRALETKPNNFKVPEGNRLPVFSRNKEAFDLFQKLDLCEHYSMRIQLKDALCVRSEPLKLSLNISHPTSPQELPRIILQKLMAYDHRCRSPLLPRKSDDSDDDSEEDDDDRIHPVDSLLALLICSDDFLRQDLFSRLAKCQLAVPFILPDPFTKQLSLSLWTMHSIIKDWKCFEDIGGEVKVVDKTSPIINCKTPIISFIRFGKHQRRGVSKSKLLNDVISDDESHYNHFFHYDCAGGRSKVVLGKGLVDICWYLPSGKSNEAFTDVVTFLNLHGDAREYPQQSRFLSKISSMCFILLTENKLKFEAETIKILKGFASSTGGITILNDTKKPPAQLISEMPHLKESIIKLVNSNADKIKTSIQRRIRKKIQYIGMKESIKTLKEHCSIESAAIKDCEIIVDEGNDYFKEGFKLASQIQTSIFTSYKANEAASVKEKLLPLQGGPWRQWAKKEKELYRQANKGKKKVDEYTDIISKQKQALRQDQLKHVETLTSVMHTFITSLLKLEGPSNKIVRRYFLQSLKLELDEFSRGRISEFQQQYQSTRIKLSEMQDEIRNGKKPVNKEQMNQYKKKIEILQDHIIKESIGLEHLLRELGQIYEASAQQSPIPDLMRLPKVAAELLIEGYPFELMDGDATHVPLKWVSTVIDEAAHILGDPKIFVLSVLGLQNTGKSTMLNTVFGLQYNVTSGRCTRGAFMQLLPLDEHLTDFSYVLIVDTEGLRAPELDYLETQKHDNELATFIIGLANMTLINIFGLVPGDIDDILQTSVHAFLRMSEISKFKKSCKFVHQNTVSGKNTEVSRANFTQKLDKFTVDAAKEENVEGQYERFNDVLKFNDLKDVHYFPGLWKGGPPMAPVNLGYSDAAQNLKHHFIEALVNSHSRVGSLSLSSFKTRVEDLWEALLKENFLFSFKNTLEITAYNSLETQYCLWEWQFHAAMLKWERNEQNVITTAEPSIISALVEESCKELSVHVAKLHGKYSLEMDEFFVNSKLSDTLVNWKAMFEEKLDSLKRELKIHAENYIRKLSISRQAMSEFERKRSEYRELIINHVQVVIANLKQDQELLHANIRRGKLDHPQLQKILKVLTPDYLQQYKDHEIISEDQEHKIREIIRNSGGTLTEHNLNEILVGGVLTTDQVIKILSQIRESEQELKVRFDHIWIEMLKKIPYVPADPDNVEYLVEKTLLSHVKAHEGQLLAKIRETTLRHRGASLELIVEEKKHLNQGWQRMFVKANTKKAQDITDEILEKARSHLQSITDLETDFNSAFTLELLRELDDEIEKHTSECKDVTFTQQYKLDLSLSVCSYAVVEFEKMAESFRKKNNPRLYMETENKGPLFTIFKNQYYQTKAEEGIANTLCAHFDRPIRTQVQKSLGSTIVGQMKSSEYHFKSKMALKVKILTDLYEEDDFNSYMVYLTDIKRCLEERLRCYTIEYCDGIVSGIRNTRLQNMAKEEVSRLAQFIEKQVTELSSEPQFITWLETFCDNVELRRELGVKLNARDIINGYDHESIQNLNLENVKSQIRKGLMKSIKNLHASFDEIKCEKEMETWTDKPHDFLKELVGCTEQCPFCGEQCDLLGADHTSTVKHHTAVHRSVCLKGYQKIETQVLQTEFCPTKIASEIQFRNSDTKEEMVNYSDYRTIYPNWTIEPDVTSKSSLYWKLFVGRYKDQIAEKFGGKPPEVPESWSKIEWEVVEANLQKIYHL